MLQSFTWSLSMDDFIVHILITTAVANTEIDKE